VILFPDFGLALSRGYTPLGEEDLAGGNIESPHCQDQAMPEEGLVRGLTRWHALAIVVGAMLGTGIYIRPANIAQLVGSPALIVTVWIGTGLLCLAGALTYAELARNIPRSGGEYAFLRVTLGELPAFLFGWMRLTIGAGTVAAMAVASVVFLSDVMPIGGAWVHIENPWIPGTVLADVGPRQLLAVLVIVALGILNARGVGKAGHFQSWITAAKTLSLAGLIGGIAFLGHVNATPNLLASVAPMPVSPSAFGAAVLAAVAAYNGWATVAMVAGEVQDARRTLPWALTVGVLTVIGMYVAANLGYLHALSMADILSANSTIHPNATSIGSRAANAALGPRVGSVLPLLFMISALGTLHSNMLTVPRVFFAMARDGLLPRGLARISPTARTPVVAIVVLASVGSVFAVLGSYDRLSNMAAFGFVLFYVLNALGLLWWRHHEKSNNRANTLTAKWIPVLFLGGMLWLLIVLIAHGSVEIMAALLLMALGLPVYAVLRYHRR
jgi:amino acid transporter